MDRFVDVAVTRMPVESLCKTGFAPELEKTWTTGSVPLERYLSGDDITTVSLRISQTRYVKVRINAIPDLYALIKYSD